MSSRPASTRSVHGTKLSSTQPDSKRPSSSKSMISRPPSSKSISSRPSSSFKSIEPMKTLVTDGFGYLGMHIVYLLLKDGHSVRAAVKSLADEDEVNSIKKLEQKYTNQLELIEADILSPDSWVKAVDGINIVFHVASVTTELNITEEEHIQPAIEGTMNVLKACLDTSVTKVIMTSQQMAMHGENPNHEKIYTEEDWAEPGQNILCKSRILTEQAGWALVGQRKAENQPVFELSVINAGIILGPVMNKSSSVSIDMFKGIFKNGPVDEDKLSMLKMYSPISDVRDLALAHYRASFMPDTAGKRFLVQSQKEWIQIGTLQGILANEFNPKGMTISEDNSNTDGPGKDCKSDNTRMIEVLKVKPTDYNRTVIDMANSFVEMGLVTMA